MTGFIRNLVFEGGGVKGIAYIGALEQLENQQILSNIKRVGGSSAGAIVALILSLNYSQSKLSKILSNLNLLDFKDESFGPIGDIVRLTNEFGWYKGDKFKEWIEDIIEEKTGNKHSTFKDINEQKEEYNFKDLYILGTNLSTHFTEIFSYEHTPNMKISEAVRISMSIPLFFKSIVTDTGVYVDGGVLINYPIKLFDQEHYVENEENYIIPDYYEEINLMESNEEKFVYNMETLGFRLESPKKITTLRDGTQPQRYPINNLFDYTWNLVGTILDNQDNRQLHEHDSKRTIFINTLDVSATDFGINDTKRNALIESGLICTNQFFQDYTKPEISNTDCS